MASSGSRSPTSAWPGPSTTPTLTQSGVVTGTPQFMAPEQARGEPMDHRADLFSLGSVLYTSCRPASLPCGVHDGRLRQVCDESPAVPRINPDIPDWLVSIIATLQAKDPAARFQLAARSLLTFWAAGWRTGTTRRGCPRRAAPAAESAPEAADAGRRVVRPVRSSPEEPPTRSARGCSTSPR